MKYVRTVTGQIIDIQKAIKRYKNHEDLDGVTIDIVESILKGIEEDYGYYLWVKKEADTIEGLIMPEDLVEYDEIEYSRVEKARSDHLVGYDLEIIQKERVTAIYIAYRNTSKHDVERWTLIARKTKKGRWKLI